jgi:phosphoglycerate dehydrogenase-like enzyme
MRPKALFLLEPGPFDLIYGEPERRDAAAIAEFVAPPQTKAAIAADPSPLREAEVILSGWGMPPVDAAFLAAAPKLRAILYGAGSIRGFATDAMWARGLAVSSAVEANAIPVAEYCVAAILWSLKNCVRFAWRAREQGKWPRGEFPVFGAYGSKVGIITLGAISRILLELLKPYRLDILVFSRSLTEEGARKLGVRRASIDEIFRECEVVSLHTPKLPSTAGMITGAHFASMKPGATFLNTARGAVVHEPQMVEVLRRRPEIFAILDVTDPEPPVPGSPLYALPNVMLTPHVAGSAGPECRRMGRWMVEELARFANGQPLQHLVTREQAANMA